MTYMYRCDNKNCSPVKKSDMRLNTGWKISCCNLCDNPKCPDYGECKCSGKGSIIFNKNKTIGELKTIHIADDIEIEIFE